MEDICEAAYRGDLAEVQRLVAQDPHLLNATHPARPVTPLTCASVACRLEVVRWLVDQGAALDMRDDIQGRTALWEASSDGVIPGVRLLLESGANPAIADISDWTPLIKASERGHVETVRCLLDHPSGAATINLQTWCGETALLYACLNGHPGVVRVLLEKGADPTIPDSHGWTPMAAAKSRDRFACIEALEVSASPSPHPTRLLIGLTSAWWVLSLAWRVGFSKSRGRASSTCWHARGSAQRACQAGRQARDI
jgi:ankyrin repeat protein